MINHLYDIFKHWGNDIYVYSDPHFGDLDAYLFRGLIQIISREQFEESLTISDFTYDEFLKTIVKQADEMQIKNINKVCGKTSTLIILGDVGDIECVKKLKAGYKVLIMGNHDKGASNYKREITYIQDEEKGTLEYDLMNKLRKEDNHLFDEVYEGPLMINDRLILSHEPIPMTTYLFNIHGHVHKEVPFTTEFHLNVCAEHINYTPINLSKLLQKGLLSDVKSIHRETINNAIMQKIWEKEIKKLEEEFNTYEKTHRD